VQFKRLVADGYDVIAERLSRERGAGSGVHRWLTALCEQIQPGASVLDLGCGAGFPHTVLLAERFSVIGVDISRGQLKLAAGRLPSVDFILADMSSLEFRAASFDAVTAIYSIIHVPRAEQEQLLLRMCSWLKPSGTAFLVLGARDTPLGFEQDWFGAPMLWSHYDADESARMVAAAGFQIVSSAVEPDPLGAGAHLFLLCQAS